ncbi:MAG TPA: DUF2911 domain-containing protein [Gemmatimonadales bacterium]|nr:DUF2911 domain-containing protein [Gemmatimonadales bacterium]
MKALWELTGVLALCGAIAAARPSAAKDGCWFREEPAQLVKRASPPDSAVGTLGGAEVKVCYGRPSAKGRTIMGGLVPFDQPWRLGANEATTIHLPVAAKLGDISLKPGVYSLYAIPGAKSWQLVANSAAERWGIAIDENVRKQDVGAVTVPVEQTQAPVEKLTIRLEPAGANALSLVIEWERTRVRATLKQG